MLASLKAHVPNALTVGNLLCGMGGIYLALAEADTYAAGWCIIFAALLDVADGAVARALGVSSPIGKDLDSLADAVTFGVLPTFIVVTGLRQYLWLDPAWQVVPACLGVCAVLRLARFNNDPGQAKYFRGLPTPAAGLALVGIAWQIDKLPDAAMPLVQPAGLLGTSILLAGLMVSPLRLISFKLGLKPTLPYWVATALVAIASLPWAQGGATLVAILAYVAFSQIYFLRNPAPKA